jgi:hypothetical protein
MKTLTKTQLALAIAAFALEVHAVPTLRISDGNSTITIADGGVGDASSAAGAVTWIGSIGAWTLNTITGVTKPVVGFSDLPILDLNFFATSSGAGTLTIMFTETDFAGSNGWANLNIGGTTAGTVTYSAYGVAFGASRNTPFDTTRHLGTIGPLSGPAFSAAKTQTFLGGQSAPFSLTQVITITHSGAADTGGNARLRIPEGGSSALLLVGGIASLGILRRSRRLFIQ